MLDLAAKMLNLNEDKDKAKDDNQSIFNLSEYRSEVDKLNKEDDMDDVNDDKSSKKSGRSNNKK